MIFQSDFLLCCVQKIRENDEYSGKTHVYTYDTNGNILTKKTYAYSQRDLGTLLSTVTYTYSNDAWGNVISITDPNGNEITSETCESAWNCC